MSEHGSWCSCPNCKQDTAITGGDGKPLRCIPCGFGLVSPDRWASPEKSVENARKMRGVGP